MHCVGFAVADIFDLLVVGGGINGTAIARAAAVAGKRVLLVEQGDLAQATSSASTKLMHGGLRYLEQCEFKLVRESLCERAIMLRTAPHIVRPLEFRLPHAPSMRPWPIVRMGLWLYDLLALGGGLPRSRSVRLDGAGLKPGIDRGFSYWDGQVDDARLVVLNALDAAEAGAEIATRTEFLSATASDGIWTALLGGRIVRAKVIVNAAGPWVERALHERARINAGHHIRLVRGSHIVVPRCLEGDHAWLFQQPDGRIVFAIPWLDGFTMIGTTDQAVQDPEDSAVSQTEIEYLLTAINLYLARPLTETDIVGKFAGIRALFDDGSVSASAITRDYRLELNTSQAPILSVFGGKITTARHLAEEVLKRLGIATGKTATRPLPGGDFHDFAVLTADIRRRWPFLTAFTSNRLAHAYGTRVANILGEAATVEELGQDFGHGLTAREVDYLVGTEWAVTCEDVLSRRTKLGYRFTDVQRETLAAYINSIVVQAIVNGGELL